jgi:Zn-dependent protease
MNGNSILIGRVFGIPIRVQVLLLIMAPILALWYCSSNIVLGLIVVAGIFCSVALHELGHSWVAQRKGCHVQEIVLTPIGGAAKMSNIPSRPMDEFQIALAGPLVSLALGIIGLFSGVPLLGVIGVINLFLFAFNLLPCFPMDGGRILRAFLASRKGRLEATRLSVQIGKYFCILFVVFGLLRFQLLLAFIGFYIYQAGQMEYRMVLMEHQANHFSGFREGNLEVEVSPPPYASNGKQVGSLAEKLRGLFRR